MVLKKKEIIAASLVVLIGVAGYLNWSYQDTIRVQDGESYVETGKKLGEAQYVSSDTVAEGNVISQDVQGGSGGNINGQRGTKRQRASGGNGSNGR